MMKNLTVQEWEYKALFYDRVDRLGLHGLHFQHVTLCERRAWMYLNNINFAQWYNRVQLGTAKHQTSYTRDKSVVGLIGLSPDRLDWKKHIVYENKGTAGAVEASNNQTAFYAVVLSIVTGQDWRACISILSSRRNRELKIDRHRLDRLLWASERLEALSNRVTVPHAPIISLCGKCSFAGFCGYDQ